MNNEITIDQLEAHCNARIEALEKASLQPAMQIALDTGRADTAQAFHDTASPGSGASWPPRKDIGDGHPLLNEKGNLLAAATGGPYSYQSVQDREMEMGVELDSPIGSVKGARAHNYGYPARNLPARRFLGISEDGKVKIGKAIMDVLDTALRAVNP